MTAGDRQIDLLLEPGPRFHNHDLGPRPFPVKRCLPLFRRRNSRSQYVHRIRSANVHLHFAGYFRGESWVSYQFWCGSTGTSSKGQATADIAPHEILCATCEGRAVGAGMPPYRLIPVGPVKFSPRY